MESAFQWKSRMVFIRNWVKDVRNLASKWKFEGRGRLTGNDLEFQAEYLGSLLDLVPEEVHGEASAFSNEIASYMLEMKVLISQVHVHKTSDSQFSSQQGKVPLSKPDFQIGGFEATICPSKIAISAPPCPSSSRSSTTNFLSEDPIDLESIIPDSLSIYDAHSAITTENNGLLCADDAFTVSSTLDGVSPFLKVTPCFLVATADRSEFSVNLVAFSKAAIQCSIGSVELSSPDFVKSPTASYVLDKMPSREFQLFPYSCPLMDNRISDIGQADVLLNSLSFVFDPGKPVADWLFTLNSTVSLVADNWLSTFGVAIGSLAHDSSRIFIFDPGIAYIGICYSFDALDVILLN